MDEVVLEDLARQLEPKLPEAREKIKRFLHEEIFCDMCSEYEEGVKCLRRFEKLQFEYTSEYRELISDLQQEILLYLQQRER